MKPCRCSSYLVLVPLLALPMAAAGQARPAGAAQPAWDFSSWKLDQVTLRSGKTLEGLVESETEGDIRVLEIRRPAGGGLSGVSRTLKQAEIASIVRISPQEREAWRERFEEYANRGRVAAMRQDVPLAAAEANGAAAWRYQGQWFSLESRASQEFTRRFVVRLEQMFTAYRRLMPPRVARRQELRVMIFGVSSEYQALARSLGAPLENAAFYHPLRNLVAAGSDLAHLGGQLAQVQAQHEAVRAELERLRRELPGRLEQRRRQLAAGNLSETARRKGLVTYRRQMEQEIDALQERMDDYDRQNEALFAQQAGRVLALLHHEAFHAYLENYVYPQSEHDVPRWLNEGLAQVFEHGILEADTLRVDVPHKATLALLADDLAANPTPLAQILAADHRSFLVAHGEDRGKRLNYVYAWGLAYYLTFVHPVLGGQAMDQYVSRHDQIEPVARFERLVDQPLAEFEAQWRDWVLKRKDRE